jgi:UDP-N-acetylmuramoyl-L-alanyl-D-glutamate--2,6-diaminopimelate ligase
MVNEGVEVAAIEVSSHAIHQHRVDECRFDVLVFTNLSQDHLDYHRDIEEYFQVKASIFNRKNKEVYHIINQDDLYGQRILRISSPPVLTYGLSGEAQIRAENLSLDEKGSNFTIQALQGSLKVLSRLKGKYNVYNSLAAAAAALALGFSPDAIKQGLESMADVPGRFETVDLGQDFLVVVDYAHTPDSLEKVISAAREITAGQVITIFGCGGDRDKTKRPLMGRAAARLSDFTIITTDNPRSERPADIIAQIEAGFRGIRNKADYVKIIDRHEAIFKGVSMAKKGDLVLIAGKGHELGQTFADKTVPFDDRTIAAEAIRERISCLQ